MDTNEMKKISIESKATEQEFKELEWYWTQRILYIARNNTEEEILAVKDMCYQEMKGTSAEEFVVRLFYIIEETKGRISNSTHKEKYN